MIHRSLLLIALMLLLSNAFYSQSKTGTNSKSPLYLDSGLSINERVNDLMSRMTLEEKVAQMCQYVGLEHMKHAENNITAKDLEKNDALGFYPGMLSNDVAKMITEGKIGSFLHVITAEEANHLQELALKSRLKIPLLIGIDAIHGDGLFRGATIYPSPISQASTWDDGLQVKASSETAIEMRATGTHWSFTPNIDVLRDPRWGRAGETFGEDPYLVGNFGVATIKGLQSENLKDTDKVIACAKHLIAGSQSVNGLNASPTDISKRTLFEVFLPPYKKAIKEANVYSIMTAHNEVAGVPAHMDHFMMTNLLRDKWGFKGFYVSDWNDVIRIAIWHHVAKDFKEASLFSVSAGLDMHMHGPKFADYIVELVNEGKLREERVNEACSKILKAKFKLGLFENPFIDLNKVNKVVFSKEHKETALSQARKAVTLLSNKNILPLQKSKGKTIFITGPNANNQTTLGDWTSPQPEDNIITILEGLQQLAPKYGYDIDYLDIGEYSKEITDESIEKSALKAKESDITVLVLGENSFRHIWKKKTTGENVDRATLKLSGRQSELAFKVLESGKPVIIIYVSGSPIAEPELDSKAHAIINTWESGAFSGQAAAEAIFGELNPGGKLPVTIPRSVGQLQMVYNHKPTAYIHKYNTEKKTPLYPFGYGMSYTTFEISEPKLSQNTFHDLKDKITVSVDVKNTGSVTGDEVIQLYIRDNISSFTRPVKELKGYERITLEPGKSQTVKLEITAESLAFYNENYDFIVEPGEFTVMTGNSSADKDLQSTTLMATKKLKLNE